MRLVQDPVYVAGPMTGMPDSNYPLFDRVTLMLRMLGYRVENPADNGRDGMERTWREFMVLGLHQLLRCNTASFCQGGRTREVLSSRGRWRSRLAWRCGSGTRSTPQWRR